MASVIKAGNATDGIAISSDNTGILELKTGTGAGTTAVTIGTDQSVTFAGAVSSSGNQTVTGNLTVNGNTTLGDANTDTILMTAAPSIGGAGLGMGFGFRNRIINGAMVIDQRGTASSPVTTTGTSAYTVDRWAIYRSASGWSVQQVADAPAGFVNSLRVTTTTASAGAVALVQQWFEGFNVADFGLGTASAATFTISFWVKSSVTGTFAGNVANGALNRAYIFTYTINSANTWEQKTVTIAGDTTGTWATNNTAGLRVLFNLGTGGNSSTAGSWQAGDLIRTSSSVGIEGTLNATWNITGVQLEKGSTATSFDYRPYTTELQLCQRYYQRLYANNTQKFALSRNANTTEAYGVIPFYAPMRVAPSALEQSGTAANYAITHGVTTTTCSAVPAINSATLNNIEVFFTVASGLTAGQASVLRSLATDQFLGWSAEL